MDGFGGKVVVVAGGVLRAGALAAAGGAFGAAVLAVTGVVFGAGALVVAGVVLGAGVLVVAGVVRGAGVLVVAGVVLGAGVLVVAGGELAAACEEVVVALEPPHPATTSATPAAATASETNQPRLPIDRMVILGSALITCPRRRRSDHRCYRSRR